MLRPPLYLDSDLFVCGSLHDVAEQARRAGVVVSPHALEPRPTEGTVLPRTTTCCRSVSSTPDSSPSAAPAARSWSGGPPGSRVSARTGTPPSHCASSTSGGWTWYSITFPARYTATPAPTSRGGTSASAGLELAGDRYEVDGRPLRFFHFSSFDPRNPSVLSPLQRPHPRTDLARSPALRQLVEDYPPALDQRRLAATGR